MSDDWRRMRLRRGDGRVYLDRWGRTLGGFGVALHRMTAADPGLDLHDHPWPFASLILWGGYTEEVADARDACARADVVAGSWKREDPRGDVRHWGRGTLHVLRLDQCHRITRIDGHVCWTLVVRVPKRRDWGFYPPKGWIDQHAYDASERRDLYNEV